RRTAAARAPAADRRRRPPHRGCGDGRSAAARATGSETTPCAHPAGSHPGAPPAIGGDRGGHSQDVRARPLADRGGMNIVIAILACEIGFWIVLLAGLATRYLLRLRRLSTVLLL